MTQDDKAKYKIDDMLGAIRDNIAAKQAEMEAENQARLEQIEQGAQEEVLRILERLAKKAYQDGDIIGFWTWFGAPEDDVKRRATQIINDMKSGFNIRYDEGSLLLCLHTYRFWIGSEGTP